MQVWAHHATGSKALMPHSRCMRCLRERKTGKELGVFESRQILENLMARAVAPARVYAHRHETGDVVLIDNWSCWHSTTGALQAKTRE